MFGGQLGGMEQRTPGVGRSEVLFYAAVAMFVHVGAVVPHVLEYGWAWEWPGAGPGFPLTLLLSVLTLGIGVRALIRALVKPRVPRAAFVLRVLTVPVLLIGPSVVFCSFVVWLPVKAAAWRPACAIQLRWKCSNRG